MRFTRGRNRWAVRDRGFLALSGGDWQLMGKHLSPPVPKTLQYNAALRPHVGAHPY